MLGGNNLFERGRGRQCLHGRGRALRPLEVRQPDGRESCPSFHQNRVDWLTHASFPRLEAATGA
jgi:hypothetical protein